MSTYLKCLQNGLHLIMQSEKKCIILGEDVKDPYGGAFKVTKGLSTAFPERVMSTPISEAALVGVGAGLALRGHIPIVEIMFGDFVTLCMDQIVNHATKFPLMYPETICPLIIRTPMGGGRGYGPTHSQSIEKVLFGIPGLTVVAPSLVQDPSISLRNAVESSKGPVLYLENKILYSKALLSIPDIKVESQTDLQGYHVHTLTNHQDTQDDLCLIGYGGVSRMICGLLDYLNSEEIKVKIVIPERIDPLPLGLIVKQAKHAKRILVLEEGYAEGGWTDYVSAHLQEPLHGMLDAPIFRLSSKREIIPTSFDDEAVCLIDEEKIISAIQRVILWRSN